MAGWRTGDGRVEGNQTCFLHLLLAVVRVRILYFVASLELLSNFVNCMNFFG